MTRGQQFIPIQTHSPKFVPVPGLVIPVPAVGLLIQHVPRIKTDFGRRAFSSAAPQIWNHIPTAIRGSQSVDSFKRHLKTDYFASP